jgi:hypothetical protein
MEFCIHFLLASYMDSPLQIYDLCTPAILAEAADFGVHYKFITSYVPQNCILRGCIDA